MLIAFLYLPVLMRFNQAANVISYAKDETIRLFKSLRYDLRLQDNSEDQIENLTMLINGIEDHDLNF